jgi:hypothetical protein
MGILTQKEQNANCDPLHDQNGAAAYLCLSPRTLELWRAKGNGPRYVKMGGKRVLYRQSDLETFIRECLRISTSDSGGSTKRSQSR